jgi:hypothetical protein
MCKGQGLRSRPSFVLPALSYADSTMNVANKSAEARYSRMRLASRAFKTPAR